MCTVWMWALCWLQASDRSGFEAKGHHSFTKWWLKVSSAWREDGGGQAQVMKEEVDGCRRKGGHAPHRGERLVSHSKTSQQPIRDACKCAVQWTMTDLVSRTFTTHTHVQEHTQLTFFFSFLKHVDNLLFYAVMYWAKTKVRRVAVGKMAADRAGVSGGEEKLPPAGPAAAPKSAVTLIMKLRVTCKEELI